MIRLSKVCLEPRIKEALQGQHTVEAENGDVWIG